MSYVQLPSAVDGFLLCVKLSNGDHAISFRRTSDVEGGGNEPADALLNLRERLVDHVAEINAALRALHRGELVTARVPTVHLNGSSGGALLAAHHEALRVLRAFSEALAECTPNDRDFYVQGADAGKHARNEHAGRVAMVDKLRIELTEISYGIQEQLNERERATRPRTP